MTIEPVPLSSTTTGHGRLAVLIHGITENRHTFDPLVPALSQRYRVLAPDLRGHGESAFADDYSTEAMVADVAALVSREAPGEVPLVIGHSLGGMVAAAYAARHPARAVVNIDQSLQLGAMQEQILTIEPLLRGDECAQVITGMMDQMAGAASDAEKERLGALRRIDQAVILGVWAPLLDESADELAATVDGLVTAPEPYPYLQIDGLPSGEDYPAWLAERIGGAVVDDWGVMSHYPHLMEPERFLAAVDALDPE